MKRVAVLVLGLLLAVGALAWGQIGGPETHIWITLGGSGDHDFTEVLVTNAGLLIENISVQGFMMLDKTVDVDEAGNFQEAKYFSGDGYVDFFEWLEIDDPSYNLQESINIEGYGWVEVEKEASVYFDPTFDEEGSYGKAAIELSADIYGFFYGGSVNVYEYGMCTYEGFWPWYLDQDLAYELHTFDTNEHVTHQGHLETESFGMGIDAGLFMESFWVSLDIEDYAW